MLSNAEILAWVSYKARTLRWTRIRYSMMPVLLAYLNIQILCICAIYSLNIFCTVTALHTLVIIRAKAISVELIEYKQNYKK